MEFPDNHIIEELYSSGVVTNIATSQEYKSLIGEYNDLFDTIEDEELKDKLEKLTPEIQTAEIYKYIGLCYDGLGNYNEALNNLDKSILLFDDDKTVNSKYNEIKAKIGK